MGTPADIKKLMDQMQRAQALTDQAADSGKNSEVVMDNFQTTLGKFNDQVGKMKEYTSQLDAMLSVTGNGGPPLETTFPPPVDVVHEMPVVAPVTEASSVAFDVRGVAVSEVPQG
jgi:hypothetical protein